MESKKSFFSYDPMLSSSSLESGSSPFSSSYDFVNSAKFDSKSKFFSFGFLGPNNNNDNDEITQGG